VQSVPPLTRFAVRSAYSNGSPKTFSFTFRRCDGFLAGPAHWQAAEPAHAIDRAKPQLLLNISWTAQSSGGDQF